MRTFVSRNQIALRIGSHFMGLRRGREYFSERNRRGWTVLYLPFGWRFFYRRVDIVINHNPTFDGVHTIPVPRGWSPEQAWEAISKGDLLTDPEPAWAHVLIKGGRYMELIDDES